MNYVNTLIGVNYSANAILNVALTTFLLIFIFKCGLGKKMGFCKPSAPMSRFLWFIPLAIISTYNLWYGVGMSLKPLELTCYITYMLLVGIIEEIIFRGFLFNALAKSNVKCAIVVSSITFGLGHIVNLITGVNSDVFSSVCQIVGAIAIGFMFAILYYRGGSIIPCIVAHSAMDIFSAFVNEAGVTTEKQLIINIIKVVLIAIYVFILLKTLPNKQDASHSQPTELTHSDAQSNI